MYKYFLSTILVLSSIFFSGNLNAQELKDTAKVNERIILQKDGTFPKDMTIRIQGDKITINGKVPKDIDIIREKSSANSGKFKSFQRSFERKGGNQPSRGSSFFDKGNRNERALLGVITKADDDSKGADIVEVERGTPADSAGLQKGDVVIGIENDKEDYAINSPSDLSNVIAGFQPGEKIKVRFLREEKEQQVSLSLGRISGGFGARMPGMQDDFGGMFPQNRKGLQDWFEKHHPPMLDQNPQLRMMPMSKGTLGVRVENNENPKGVKVIRVEPGTPAEKAEFKSGDVITKFAGEAVDNVPGLKKLIQQKKDEKEIKVQIIRGNKTKTLQVSLGQQKDRFDL